MFKCRRIISCIVIVCLFLAFVAPSIVFKSFADEGNGNSQLSIYFRPIFSDGTTGDRLQRIIEDGFLYTQGVYGIRIEGFQYRPVSASQKETFYFTFRISGYSSNETSFSLNVSNSSISHSSSSSNINNRSIRSFASGRADDIFHADDGIYWKPASKTSTWILKGTSNTSTQYESFDITLSTPYDIKPTSNSAIWFYIDNIYYSSFLNSEIDYYSNALPFLSNINDAVFQLYTNLLVYMHPFTEISYDEETGEFTTSNNVGNWFDAVLGSIQSLNADAIAQTAQQQRANEAGAGDALDTAYDSVGDSFGSLGEFSGLGDLGTFNGSAMGNAGSAGILDWFSQQTADSIDSVARSRSPLDIVDFYSSKIEEYEEVIADGATDP